MTLQDKIIDIQKTSKLTEIPLGTAYDFDEFWNNFIEPRLPKKSVVLAWHKLLMEYINEKDAVFFIRAFAGPSGNSDLLRRGFYNTTNYGFSAFYGDNGCTAYFYSMAFDGYVPTLKEFEDVMKGRVFPCSYIQTKSERAYAAYHYGKNPGITTKGYKIAHVFSSGKNFDEASCGYNTIGDFCKKEFPRGESKEWSSTRTDVYGKYHYREIKIKSMADADRIRKFLVAHFLRTVHPINYFLVPKKAGKRDRASNMKKTNIYWYDDSGILRDEIGENKDLILYVANKLKAIYGTAYDEFVSLIFPLDVSLISAKNKIINAEYGPELWRTKMGIITKTKSPKYSKPAVKSASTSGTFFTKTKLSIDLTPSDINEFKKNLLAKKQAERIVYYSDGTIRRDTWNASKFSHNSNVLNNIKSKYRNWKTDGIIRIEIKCDK